MSERRQRKVLKTQLIDGFNGSNVMFINENPSTNYSHNSSNSSESNEERSQLSASSSKKVHGKYCQLRKSLRKYRDFESNYFVMQIMSNQEEEESITKRKRSLHYESDSSCEKEYKHTKNNTNIDIEPNQIQSLMSETEMDLLNRAKSLLSVYQTNCYNHTATSNDNTEQNDLHLTSNLPEPTMQPEDAAVIEYILTICSEFENFPCP
ncbi:hypothetical protein ABK040_001848 [Willaertia magna]